MPVAPLRARKRNVVEQKFRTGAQVQQIAVAIGDDHGFLFDWTVRLILPRLANIQRMLEVQSNAVNLLNILLAKR